jgi:phage FluMu protein Com
MNLRCAYCQTPFTVGRNQILLALQTLHAEGLHHYDAHCPRCRKANQVSLQQLERFYPNWQDAPAVTDTTAEATDDKQA